MERCPEIKASEGIVWSKDQASTCIQIETEGERDRETRIIRIDETNEVMRVVEWCIEVGGRDLTFKDTRSETRGRRRKRRKERWHQQ